MGYSAYVVCRCYQDGKTIDPPFKEYVCFDDDGLHLDLPEEMPYDLVYENENIFGDWKMTACEHEEMELCYEDLCNNLGMSQFRYIVKIEGGEKAFPILSKYLPTANGGMVPSEVAEDFLEELERLGTSSSFQSKIVLREKSTQRILMDVDSEQAFTFIYGGNSKHNGILSRDGFIIAQKKVLGFSYVVFQSKHFTEQHIGEELYRFVDIASGKEYECKLSILAYEQKDDFSLYELEVGEEKISVAQEYDYIIEPLIKLAKASIESGNPIHWC